jgi:hypothetical protein
LSSGPDFRPPLTALAIERRFPNIVEQPIVSTVWFFALLAGAVASLGVYQALTGHRTLLFTPLGINWSVGELRVFGLAGAIFALSLAVYTLVFSLAFAANQFPWFGSLTVMPLIVVWPVFQGLMKQRHNRHWPFKGQPNPS